jgi:hypothetical protein
MTEMMGAATATADVNGDGAMVSSPTPEELATTRELVRAAQARGVSFADTADGGAEGKGMVTDTVGPVEIALPRDRDGSFDRSSSRSARGV